jgi:hypothetical protein
MGSAEERDRIEGQCNAAGHPCVARLLGVLVLGTNYLFRPKVVQSSSESSSAGDEDII